MHHDGAQPCFRHAHVAMRTRFELALPSFAPDDPRARSVAEALWQAVDETEALLSPFRPDSDLSRLAARAGAALPMHPFVMCCLDLMAQLVDATAGAFDPTVGPLMRCLRAATPASDEQLTSAASRIGFRRHLALDLERGTATVLRDGVELDPGGIGKGLALDRASAVLDELKIAHALLHGGTSSARARGAFTIAIADPRQPAGAHLARARLADAALSVSARDGRRLRWPDGSTGHVVDPSSGRAARGALLAAVVVPAAAHGYPAAVAEGWSTALTVLGKPGLLELCRVLPEASALLLDEARGAHLAGAAFDLVPGAGPC